MEKYFFNNTVYNLIDKRTLSLPDSFVLNKKGKGAGEAKLYIGSTKSDEDKKFISNFAIENKNCIALRSDFEKYFSFNHNYFLNPPTHYEKIQTEDFLIQSLSQTENIINFGCEVFIDDARTYIRSQDDGFKLFRLFGAFDISSLKILKLKKDSEITYYFEIISKNNEEEKKVNDESIPKQINSSATIHTSPIQKIFYGVPGCGKSHKISEMLEDKNIFNITSEENQIVRTVFHPDYTNADFVGQILPEVKGDKIEYNFKEGPFTEILAKALLHPENQYVLIIEEINRGNSAAIFGEIFQLLDRIEDGVTSVVDGVNKFGQGWSEYFFMNDLINEYVRKMASPSDNVETSVQINGITFTENTGIRLPPNLSLLATMNTSDQNVFTLDNAFQRRWDMEYISNKYDESTANDKQKAQYESKIGTTAIPWGKFRDAINKEISNPENSFANAEDKQLGLFFIKAENNVINESDFSNKVLKYLWNDIFKRDKSIFNDDVSTFGDLLEAFRGDEAFINTFSSDFVSKIAE